MKPLNVTADGGWKCGAMGAQREVSVTGIGSAEASAHTVQCLQSWDCGGNGSDSWQPAIAVSTDAICAGMA